MRKVIISIMALLSLVLTSASAYAITGKCSNCHTMHNSQDGKEVATGGPFPQLLAASCIGCHTETETGNIPPLNSFGTPIVWHTTDPGGQGRQKTLAGGDFFWVVTTDSKGHNVAGIANQDVAIGKTPPGWDKNATPGAIVGDGQIAGGSNDWGDNQLTCAGKFGCHGNHTDADQSDAIEGAHHGNIGLTTTRAESPMTIGGSYRFLGGINGLEDSQWNWLETATQHNEYYGAAGNASYANKRTMSYSCAQCHGIFHSDIAGGSWVRHPTDILLPSDTTKEYQYYNPDGLPAGSGAILGNTDYSIEAPVARPTVPVAGGYSKEVAAGTDIVMCLSCHRAHGSDQPDILRWDYAAMRTGDFTDIDSGCFTCHTTKNKDAAGK